ncbi:hypothetical protein BH11PLA2_BH11PLA2_05430 [soil metagenome]
MPTDSTTPLRAALDISPTNVPLRLLLADTFLTQDKLDDAESTLKEGLTRSPNDPRLTVGLAKIFLKQGKYAAGLMACEGALTRDDAPAEGYITFAKLLLRSGETDRAADAYRKAIAKDSSLAEEELAGQLASHDEDEDDIPFGNDDDDFDMFGRVPAFGASPGENVTEVERPKINFADVGGMDAVKEDIRLKIIYPLQHADLYKAYGKAIGGGMLLYGPPGCGKTHLARATAGEVKAGFLAIGLHDVLNMWLGNSEKNLHALFNQARRNAPCVLFFDEVDALAASRADFRQTNARTVINQFLSELDGMTGNNDGVLILAATNAPWHMDSAFRRPGRFDRIAFVPPPDVAARASILQLHVGSKPQGTIDFNAVAKVTIDFSGADLKAVIDRAIEAKLQDAMRTGVPKPLLTQDLLNAARTVKPSTREWFADAKNYAMYANDGGQYDDLAAYMKLK